MPKCIFILLLIKCEYFLQRCIISRKAPLSASELLSFCCCFQHFLNIWYKIIDSTNIDAITIICPNRDRFSFYFQPYFLISMLIQFIARQYKGGLSCSTSTFHQKNTSVIFWQNLIYPVFHIVRLFIKGCKIKTIYRFIFRSQINILIKPILTHYI